MKITQFKYQENSKPVIHNFKDNVCIIKHKKYKHDLLIYVGMEGKVAISYSYERILDL